jgi:flagellar FliL protein
MADEDSLDLDGDDGSITGGPKKSNLFSGMLFTILKWVAISVGAVLLIVTVVVITTNVMIKDKPSVAAYPSAEEYKGKRETLSWYSSLGQIRTKSSDILPASIVVEVVLGYKLDDKTTASEITSRQIEIKDFLRRYFTEKTSAELRPFNEDKLRIEIRNSINDDILSTTKIRDVRFLSLEVIEQ